MQSSITRTEQNRKSFLRKVFYVALPTIAVGVYFVASVAFENYALSQLVK